MRYLLGLLALATLAAVALWVVRIEARRRLCARLAFIERFPPSHAGRIDAQRHRATTARGSWRVPTRAWPRAYRRGCRCCLRSMASSACPTAFAMRRIAGAWRAATAPGSSTAAAMRPAAAVGAAMAARRPMAVAVATGVATAAAAAAAAVGVAAIDARC